MIFGDSYALPPNLPAVNCHSPSRQIEHQTSFVAFFNIPQSDPILKSRRFKKNVLAKKLKKTQGYPCLFLNFRSIFFCRNFKVWWLELVRGTKKDVYRRLFLTSSIYRVKKWNLKFPAFPSNLPPAISFTLPIYLSRQSEQFKHRF